MKSVLTSIQPYYVFLIIARAMWWRVEQEKTVEVRKSFPKAYDWDKRTIIYCTKSKRSFKRIPKEYQPLMTPFLGKVVGEFVCDRIDEYVNHFMAWRDKNGKQFNVGEFLSNACLTVDEVSNYIRGSIKFYGWHISDLKIYDQPKELSEFTTPFCPYEVAKCKVGAHICGHYTFRDELGGNCDYAKRITTPPQSWMYV